MPRRREPNPSDDSPIGMRETRDGERRVQFDFEIDFTNGGGIQGQEFRLDIDGDNISDGDLAGYIVRDLRLLMVRNVKILNKKILREPHKRARATTTDWGEGNRVRIDLSHIVEDGMITYPGLPPPIIRDHLSREESRKHYAPGTEFQIARFEMVANTGTYLDSPFHRYAAGDDVAQLPLERLADLDGIRVDVTGQRGRGIGRLAIVPFDVRGKAVLLHTGWDRFWRTSSYFEGHPFLTADAANFLVESKAAFVGIDSLNIDDTRGGERPVHSALLSAGIPICEHLTNLSALPIDGFRFSAVPAKVRGMGTFPVRAYATIETSNRARLGHEEG